MLCWPWIRWWWSRNNRRWTVGRLHAGSDGAACFVVGAVQNMCGKASCLAGSTETDEEDPTVTIPPELEAQILRYYHVEKWRVGTIARQLRVHPETVARVLAQAGLPRIGAPRRPLKIDPWSAVHPRDAGQVPDADRQPPARDGLGTRLSRRAKSFPRHHCLPSATSDSGGLSAPAHAAR